MFIFKAMDSLVNIKTTVNNGVIYTEQSENNKLSVRKLSPNQTSGSSNRSKVTIYNSPKSIAKIYRNTDQ